MRLKLLVNPLSRGAWFADHLAVAQAELAAHFAECEPTVERLATLDLVAVDLPETALPQLARLSWVQGVFQTDEAGALIPLDLDPGFALPDDLVWGAKYRGKTNEVVTQLALNVALAHCTAPEGTPLKLLDPMAGRGTTLLWAARYGLEARGIERDRKALDDLQRHVKRQTKLHRIKHRQQKGFVGPRNREDVGRFLQYTFGERSLKLVIGDSRDTVKLLGREKVHLIVTDMPYGVQHVGRGGTRNPLGELADCTPGWAASLAPGGAMVIVFNSLLPKRAALAELFAAQGLTVAPFSAPHRMSESILRDLLVVTRPAA